MDEARQRLNLRTSEVSTRVALQGFHDGADRIRREARELLRQAREKATSDALRDDIDRVERELLDGQGRQETTG